MALAMSGATCLLLGFAMSSRHLPEAAQGPRAGERRDAPELEVQLMALAPQSDAPGDPHAATRTRPVVGRPAPTPTRRRASGLEQPAATPELRETPPLAASREAATQSASLASSEAPDHASVTSVPAAGSPSGDAHGQGDRVRATSEPATPAPEILPFGDGMTRPRLLAGRQPAYTAQALAAHVEGKVIVRCVITERGDARDCRILKALPLLDRAAVQALLESRFAPATFRGQRVAVNYLFTFDFKLP